MSKREIIERERRWALPAAIACAMVPVAFIGGLVVSQGTALDPDQSEAETLRAFDADSGTLLVSAILQAVGLGAIAAPLLYLFRAAEARSDAVRRGLVGVVVAGPLFYAGYVIAQWVGLDAVAGDFVASGGEQCPQKEIAEQDDCITDLVSENGAFAVAQGLQLAGVIGMLAGLVYTSLHAMRAGLLTRFFGSLGMALGVSVLFLGPLGIIVFVLPLALLFADRWPGGRPPAWDEGRAIPWPKPGEAPPPESEERPAEVQGSAEEIFEEPSVEDIARDPRRRKRKRR